ncbi:hypothetical protein A2165_02695 [Candidatus Curtissbacteria bacterium RBG_13_40_7]|uniref:Glycosyltransferase RgtA/B/C/D-like domain-containing protein n=1 Tax=Candidatus Curtissbacteria bacterium RBG_13_40_7 TaxID=1797706 RepID=A0A1F5FV79_9BACT|nr:MAG: hypothetical protein A2165_02695 [Candidatus Curtissbacteria bacterium RBG_13_40_7]
MPLFFWVGRKIFGLNPFGYHFIVFAFHFLNIALIGYISLKLIKKIKAAIISSFLYSTAAFHFMSLSWLSLAWNVFGQFFFLLSFVFYIKFREKKSTIYLFATLFSFLAAFLSFEFAIVFPVLILICEYVNHPKFEKNFTKSIPVIIPVAVVILVYLFSRFFLYPIPAQGEYKISIEPDTFKNLAFYGLWLFNVPEELKYQVIISKLYITSNLLNAMGNLLIPVVFLFFLNIILIAIIAISTFNKHIMRYLFSSIVFFIIGLAPVLFLTKHTFPYYLTVPSIYMFLFLGMLVSSHMEKFKNTKKIFLGYMFIIGWLTLSVLTLNLTKRIHWLSGEQSISKKTIEMILNEYPKLPDSKIVFVKDANGQVKQSLMDQNAFKVIYNNDEVRTIFEK